MDDSVFNKKEVTVYPNPAREKVIVTVKNNPIEKVQLFNVLGQKIVDVEVNNLSEISLNVSQYDEGIYFLRINNDFTQKIIIKR